MIKIVNTVFSFLKVLLLLVSFVFSFYIIINMYRRLEKNMMDAIFNFIPFVLLFILFAINLIFRQKSVNQCFFYNITCCLVFGMLLFAVYRTFFDRNMVVMLRLGYDINFNYFADIIAPMKAMLYILSVSNILLMLEGFHWVPKKKEMIVSTNLDKKVIEGTQNGVNIVKFNEPIEDEKHISSSMDNTI